MAPGRGKKARGKTKATPARRRQQQSPATKPHPGFQIELLSKEPDDELAQRYRDFRLEAIKADPEVPGPSYEEESQQPLQYWRDRLAEPRANVLVAVNDPDHKPPVIVVPNDTLKNSKEEWLGMLVVLGPQNVPVDTIVEYQQHAWDMFTDPMLLAKGFDSGAGTFAITDLYIRDSSSATAFGVGVGLSTIALKTAERMADRWPTDLPMLRCICRLDKTQEDYVNIIDYVGFDLALERRYTPQEREPGVKRPDRDAYIYETRCLPCA